MITSLMTARFNAFMNSFFRVAYFCSLNGQITATVINDIRGIFITTTVYGVSEAFNWKPINDEKAMLFERVEYKKCKTEADAIAAVEATFKAAGIRHVSGIDAWARISLQFSIISCKWRLIFFNNIYFTTP